MSEEFDWDDVADDIVQQEVQQVAIYKNPNGDAVIRQRQAWDEEYDSVIIIARGNVEAAVAAMGAALGQAEEPSSAPLSGAERQRRYRNRNRNENGDGESQLPLRIVTDQESLTAAE